MKKNPANLLSRKLLAGNVLLSLLGSVLPIIVAIIAIPLLIRGLGTERFGVLSLVWMFIGYFSLFDLGLGRATTKLVAEKIGSEHDSDIPALFWTSSLLMAVVSVSGLLLLYGSSEWLVYSILKINPELESETVSSFHLIAFSLPFIVHSAALRGFLTAYQRFGLVSIVRIPQGVLSFVGPLLVLPFTTDLVVIVTVLIILRIITWLSYLLFCLNHYSMLKEFVVSKVMIRPLLSFSGWMTVSNIVSPIMVNLDRLFVGAIVSVTAVAFYAAPYQVVTKLLIIPIALQAVLFPALSHALALDIRRAETLFRHGLQVIMACQFPVLLIAVMFAGEGLTFWLGEEFSTEGTLVVQVLAAGVFLNGLAMIPFAFIQGAGRPDITAKFHLLELPFYVIMLWVLLSQYGIVGAAVAWSFRVGIDLCLLLGSIKRLYPLNREFIRRIALCAVLVLGIFLTGSQVSGVIYKVVFMIPVSLIYFIVAWRYLLNNQERMTLMVRVKNNV